MTFSSFEVVEGENSVFALSENREMGGANIAIVGKSARLEQRETGGYVSP